MSTHRVGILGCAARGRRFAAALASVDAADLVLCADDDPSAAQVCASAFGGAAASGWNDAEIDVLIVTRPELATVDLVSEIPAGKLVLVDPPLARGVVDARRTVRAAEAAPGRVGMAFEWRFEALVQLVRAVMPRLRFAHLYTAVDPGSPQMPTSVRQTIWTAPHHGLDLIAYLYGGAPAEVVADGGPLPGPTSVPARADALVADLYFDRERHAALTVAGCGGDPDLGSVVLDATDGVTRARIWSGWTCAEFLPLDGRTLELPQVPGVQLERRGRALLARIERQGQALRDLFDACLAPDSDDARHVGLADGARAVALTRAVLAAAASGRSQSLRAA